jgi:CRISPR/Cas system-associated exonuclease Cas4 (RecB family)
MPKLNIRTEVEEDGKLLKLSSSRVDTYKQCPRKYYYRYIAKIPTKDWPHFALGTYAHLVLELFHTIWKSQQDIDIRKLMGDCLKTAYEKMKDEVSIEQIQEVKPMLSNYLLKAESEGRPNVVGTEISFLVSLDHQYDLMGFIDRVDIDSDGIFHILDYKTNKNARYMKPSQLNIYGIYLLDKYPEISTFRGSYIMLRLDSKRISFDFTVEDVDKCRKTLISQAQKIMDEERWIRKPQRLCNWCDFSDVCNSW